MLLNSVNQEILCIKHHEHNTQNITTYHARQSELDKQKPEFSTGIKGPGIIVNELVQIVALHEPKGKKEEECRYGCNYGVDEKYNVEENDLCKGFGVLKSKR